ncbi:ferredoxin--NADP reductase [Parasediminibacterium paludis]|uniref:Ferredoxin--NADP reductase n=1 Tax=Parasediminibacterium paludis TaxID=908966 RepID=A0ABV8PVB4_9BACT
MLEPWRKGIITKIEQATPTTRRFFITIPEMEIFDFKPGQFVTLDLPIHEQKNKRWRSYSIASAPNGTNTFELIIVLLPDGLGTTYLFKGADVGTEIMLRGPVGVFTMPSVLDKDLYLICTGTGIAPFRSMVHYIHKNKIPHKNIYLIFGCRTLLDALYKDEMITLAVNEPNFFYQPTFSKVTDVPNGFSRGYVHAVYEKIIQENNFTPANFYLCGWKEMIDEAREKIVQLGYEKKDIHFELYG